MLASLIRHTAYPLVLGGSAAAILLFVERAAIPCPGMAAVTLIGIAAVALLERWQPYQRDWLRDHTDGLTDAIHLVVNLGLLWATASLLHVLRDTLPALALWPARWPIWSQVLLAGLIVDAGLYAMHRLSHRVEWLWRLHAPHHSAERLYWMNGERRHPLSAVCLAGPGIAIAVALGAPPLAISAWLGLLAVHLAFQHANLDYTVGPLRHVLGVAEIHRWHHKREYENAQVNFGEFWMLWDKLFGSFHDRPNGIAAGEVGLRDRSFPRDYAGQLLWPFRPRSGLREGEPADV